MELIDRYLKAVKFWLPGAQQEDIIAELSEDIRSQIEDRELELGRKLNEGEVVEILKGRGRPLLVANSYLPQRYLIGPLLLPVYWFVLKIVLACYLVPSILVWMGFMIFSPSYRAAHSGNGAVMGAFASFWGFFWVTACISIGVVTIVFAVIERFHVRSKFLDDWNPRKLPPARDPNQIPRATSVFELTASMVCVVWWTRVTWSPIILDQHGVRITLTPNWSIFFWAFLLISIAQMPLSGVNLLRPYWTRARATLKLALDGIGAVAFCWLVKAQPLQEIVAPRLSTEKAGQIVDAINGYLSKSFPLVVVLCAIGVCLANVPRIVRLSRTTNRFKQTLGASVASLTLAVAASGLV